MYQYPDQNQQPASPASSPYGSAPQPPASADMSQPDQQQSPQGFSHGGMPSLNFNHGGMAHLSKPHRLGSMIDAHFNKKELDVLDYLQGKKMVDRRSGHRIYPDLEHIVKNPHFRETMHGHFKDHLATGGHVAHQEAGQHMHALARNGRFGDTEIAKIGPHLHVLLNHMAGHATHNPHDGHPEYWSLGGALGSMWNSLKGVGTSIGNKARAVGRSIAGAAPGAARSVASNLAPMAAEKLGQRFGGNTGAQIGNQLGSMAGKALAPTGPMTPMEEALSKGFTRAGSGLMTGEGARSAIGGGLHTAGSTAESGPLSSGVARLGQGLESGQSPMDAIKAGANETLNQGAKQMYGVNSAREAIAPALSSAARGIVNGLMPQEQPI